MPAATACTGVPGMQMAVVGDFKLCGLQYGKQAAHFFQTVQAGNIFLNGFTVT